MLPNPPDGVINDIQSEVFNFIWNSKHDRVNRKTSVKNIVDGGIGIPDLRRYINALKVTWIRKLYNSNHKWKCIFLESCPIASQLQNLGASIESQNMNDFWKHVFFAYKELSTRINVKADDEFLSEPIFYNENIKIDKKKSFSKTHGMMLVFIR